MTRGWVATAWTLAATAWFAFGAPRAAEALRRARIDQTRVPTLQEQRGYAQGQPHRVTARARALFAEAEALAAREEAWSRTAAALLPPDTRSDALRRSADVPPAATDGLRAVEPELHALAATLIATHGATTAEVPKPPAMDPWGGTSRRERARALRGAVERGDVSREDAPALLAATLDALDAQQRRVEVERELWTILDDGESRRGLGAP